VQRRGERLQHSLTDYKEIEETLLWLNKYWNKPTQPLYYSPNTLEEAVSLLDEYREEAKIIAGGIDLIGLMKSKVLFPRVLINIKDIPSLYHIHEDTSGLDMGALTVLHNIEQSTLIRSKYSLLFEIAKSVGSPQIRNMATIGGNLCQEVRCWYYRRSPLTGISFTCRRKREGNACYAMSGENENHAIIGENGCVAVCASDMATGLLALDATINTVNPRGKRVIPIGKFYTPLSHILEPDEIITSIHIPKVKPNTKQRYVKFRLRKTIDFATASVAVAVTLDNNIVSDAKIAVGGVSPVPYEAVKAEKVLKGERLTERGVEMAARASVSDAMPLSKNGYKIPIVTTLVKRALLD
jgi:xanthine dehydrogenase YagS FAD-binding subunit